MSFAAERTRGQIAAGALVGSCAALIAARPGNRDKGRDGRGGDRDSTAVVDAARAARWLVLFFVSALLLPPLPVNIGDAGPHVATVICGMRISRSG